jgi:fibronectin type 3 domain-containing protein
MKAISALCTVLMLAVLVAGPPVRPVDAANQPILAIFNLRPLNIEAIGYDGEILYSLITDLEHKRSILNMPRREMEERLYQEGLSQSDVPTRVLTAGSKLGVDYVLFGNVSKAGAKIKAKISLLGVKERRVLASWSPVFSSNEEIAQATSRLADQIEAIAQGGSKSGSSLVASSAPKTPVVGVKDFKATNQGSAVVLTWSFNHRDPIRKFNIYRSSSSEGPFRYLGETSTSSFSDRKAQLGASYFYQIGVVLKDGNENRSKQLAQIKSAGAKVPHPPLILEAKGLVGRAEISCVPSLQNAKDNFKIKYYVLYRRSEKKPKWTEVAKFPAKKKSSSISHILGDDVRKLPDGMHFEYAVSSLDKKGKESALSDPVAVIITPAPVITVQKDNMLRRVDLQWVSVPNVSGYYLYRRHEAGSWDRIAKVKPDKSEYSDETDLADGQTYLYKLSAFDKQGETSPSKEVGANTKPVPKAPAKLTAESGHVKAVPLQWAPLSDPDVGGYMIYRGLNNKNMDSIHRIRGRETTSYTDKGSLFEPLKDGVTYYYTVAGYNLFKAEGSPSAFAVATTKPRPKAVQGFKASLTPAGVRLVWKKNAEPDITSYEISRSGMSGFSNTLATMQPGQTAFVDSNVMPESSYSYQIIAIDADGLQSDKMESNSVTVPK